jgi:hypothetical protein
MGQHVLAAGLHPALTDALGSFPRRASWKAMIVASVDPQPSAITTAGHEVVWFAPDRPVEGATIYVRRDGIDSGEIPSDEQDR